MRILLAMAVGLWLALILAHAQAPPFANLDTAAASQSATTPVNQCSGKSAKECKESRNDSKKALAAFNHGIKLTDKHPEEALKALNLAVQLEPGKVQYVSARELLGQQVAYQHIQSGNRLLSAGNPVAAASDFRRALEVDPGNQFASQRLLDATLSPALGAPAGRKTPDQTSVHPEYTEPEWDAQEAILRPKAGPETLHLTGKTGSAYTQIGAAFNIKVRLDSSAPDRSLHLALNQVTFEQAMDAVALVTHTFWTPVSSSEVLVAADTPAKRKELERWLMRTFYLPELPSAQALNNIANLLRTLFEFRSVTQSDSNWTVTVRGPASKILAATRFLQTLHPGRPQVMLDFEVYEITRPLLRDIGITLPSQFSTFNLSQTEPAAVIRNVQQVLLQNGTQGSVPQLTGLAPVLPALLSQRQQPNQLTAPLQNSVPTFGGGKSLMGVQIPPVTANFSQTQSRAISLSSVTLRGSHGDATTFRMGTRYPVVSASYPSGTTSLAAFPTITYEDLGITIKATPSIHQQDVTLDLGMELRSLGSQLFNGIPTINQRSYQGTITVRKDEPAVVASSVSRSDLQSLQGIPGFASVAALGRLVSDRSTEEDEEELLILITPHVIDTMQTVDSTEVYLPSNN